MAEMIERTTKTVNNVAVGTTLPASAEIELEGYGSGTVFIPVGSAITTLTWNGAQQAADQPAGPQGPANAQTYLPLYDATLAGGLAQAQTVAAGHAVQIPPAVFGCAAVKIVGNAAGTVSISLKS